jgi:hypothetical protein
VLKLSCVRQEESCLFLDLHIREVVFQIITFENVDLNTMQFIGPIIVLFFTLFIPALIIWLFFSKVLPKVLYDLLLGVTILFSLYLWAFPMNLGFYDFFK